MALIRRTSCINWYLYGDWNLQHLWGRLRQYSPAFAGALCGAAWWVLVDAVTYSRAVLHKSFPWTYTLPGCIATLALFSMNLVSREQLAEICDDAYDEGAGVQTRARCWLFFSYMVAFGAIAGSVAVLIQTTSRDENVQVGVAGLVQTGLLISSGLLLWAFRTQDEETMLTF